MQQLFTQRCGVCKTVRNRVSVLLIAFYCTIVLLNRIVTVQECDATEDSQRFTDGPKKNLTINMIVLLKWYSNYCKNKLL